MGSGGAGVEGRCASNLERAQVLNRGLLGSFETRQGGARGTAEASSVECKWSSLFISVLKRCIRV